MLAMTPLACHPEPDGVRIECEAAMDSYQSS